jgi:hypothetical protein
VLVSTHFATFPDQNWQVLQSSGMFGTLGIRRIIWSCAIFTSDMEQPCEAVRSCIKWFSVQIGFAPGPNEIAIFHPAGIEFLDGPKNQNTKDVWYDVLYPKVSLVFCRDEEEILLRRSAWRHAIASKCTT